MKAKSNGSVGGHRAQGVERRAEPQVDPLRQPRLLEVAARDARPLLVHVAADQLPVVGQAAGDADRGVAGEGAELQRPAGADRPHQEGHQRPLLGSDLHDRDPAQLGGLGGQPPQQLVLARAVLDHVAVQLRRQGRELVGIASSRLSGGRAWPRTRKPARPARRRAPPTDWPGPRPEGRSRSTPAATATGIQSYSSVGSSRGVGAAQHPPGAERAQRDAVAAGHQREAVAEARRRAPAPPAPRAPRRRPAGSASAPRPGAARGRGRRAPSPARSRTGSRGRRRRTGPRGSATNRRADRRRRSPRGRRG